MEKTDRFTMKISILCRALLVLDIFRGMVICAVLVGLFFGMSNVDVHKLKEARTGSLDNIRVDYYRNREIMVLLMMAAIALCCNDMMMALTLDHILTQKLRKAGIMWTNVSILGIVFRTGLYIFLGKYESELGLDRLDDLTPLLKTAMRSLYKSSVYYEVVKILEIIFGTAAIMDFMIADQSLEDMPNTYRGKLRHISD